MSYCANNQILLAIKYSYATLFIPYLELLTYIMVTKVERALFVAHLKL